jgi:small nuclear ribonucleoprotein (snRNP)-like protein
MVRHWIALSRHCIFQHSTILVCCFTFIGSFVPLLAEQCERDCPEFGQIRRQGDSRQILWRARGFDLFHSVQPSTCSRSRIIHCTPHANLALWFRLAVSGVLKGYDQLVNIVLDDTKEFMRGSFLLQRNNRSNNPVFLFILSLDCTACEPHNQSVTHIVLPDSTISFSSHHLTHPFCASDRHLDRPRRPVHAQRPDATPRPDHVPWHDNHADHARGRYRGLDGEPVQSGRRRRASARRVKKYHHFLHYNTISKNPISMRTGVFMMGYYNISHRMVFACFLA